MTVVDCTAPLNRYTCYGAMKLSRLLLLLLNVLVISKLHTETNERTKLLLVGQQEGIWPIKKFHFIVVFTTETFEETVLFKQKLRL